MTTWELAEKWIELINNELNEHKDYKFFHVPTEKVEDKPYIQDDTLHISKYIWSKSEILNLNTNDVNKIFEDFELRKIETIKIQKPSNSHLYEYILEKKKQYTDSPIMINKNELSPDQLVEYLNIIEVITLLGHATILFTIGHGDFYNFELYIDEDNNELWFSRY